MADAKQPTPTAGRLAATSKPDDFSEPELTAPNPTVRRAHTVPRSIATPLGATQPPSGTLAGTPPPPGPLPVPPAGLPVPGLPVPAAAPAIPAPPLPVPLPAGLPTPPVGLPLPTGVAAPGGAARQQVAAVESHAPPSDGALIRVEQFPRPAELDRRLFMAGAPDSPAAASFRVLRHRIVERKGLRVLAVTSPGRREGKTTTALNLALALGESGRARVLLVEMNLRQPALAAALGFRPPICFAEQLELHRVRPNQPWVVVENIAPTLHVAAVSQDAETRALIDGPAVAIALEQLRESDYDLIVLDCPPVLGHADMNLLTEHVDGVLFAMWRRRSRLRALRRATEQIGAARVIGTALLG